MSLANLEPTFEPPLEPTMFRSLKTLALQHKKTAVRHIRLGGGGKSAVVDLSFGGQFCGKCGAKWAAGFCARLRLDCADYLGESLE